MKENVMSAPSKTRRDVLAATAAAGALSLLSQQKPEAAEGNIAIRPFRIEVPEEKLVDLRRRIAATQWPEKETVEDASQGVQLRTMQQLARYWATEHDWRLVIVAALNSEDPQELRALALPEADPNIILTVHYYKPFVFTHQGAPWSELKSSGHIPWGTSSDKDSVQKDFAAVGRWARGRPVYLGEFGVYEKAGIESRAQYLSFIARSAELEGWSWACWQFDHDFALFVWSKDRWITPLLRALNPSAMSK